MNDEVALIMGNNARELTALIERAESFLQTHEVPERILYTARLVLEEILTNVLKYGYEDDKIHEIEVQLTAQEGEVRICFIDEGRPFDPLSVPPPPPRDSIFDCTEGGLGIYLVRKSCASVQYDRRDEKNVLTTRLTWETD